MKNAYIGSEGTIDVFKNMGILASGTGFGKAIGFLSMPFVTRIYTPEDFGVLAIFTTVILLIVPISTMLYSITIPLPKTDGMAVNIVIMCSMMILIINSILILSLVLFGDHLFRLFNVEELSTYWWVLIAGIFVASLYDLLTHWATRVQAFSIVARTKIWQSIISAVTKIFLGLVGFKPIGLLLGEVGQRGGGVISLVRIFYKQFLLNYNQISLKRIRFLLKHYIEFPIYRFPAQFMMKLSGQLPVLFFAYQYGAGDTGQLGLSLSLIGLPIALFGTSTGQAFYANISKININESHKINQLTKSILIRLVLYSLLPFLTLFALSPLLFGFVFGSEWYKAGEFTRILSIYLLFQFMYGPIGNSIFNVYKKQKIVFVLNVVRIVMVIIIFLIVYILDMDSRTSLWLYTISLSLYYLYSTSVALNVIKKAL